MNIRPADPVSAVQADDEGRGRRTTAAAAKT